MKKESKSFWTIYIYIYIYAVNKYVETKKRNIEAILALKQCFCFYCDYLL